MDADPQRKIVNTRADLAIEGAPPAFVEPLHVGRPNVADTRAYLGRIQDMLDAKWFTNDGPLVREFEARLADELGVRHVVAMCNATVALEIAVRALNLTGEVLVPSYTFIATAHAVSWQGLTPVFVDIDPTTHNIDPSAVERMITPRTTGIIGVHLWGRPAAIDELSAIAERRGLKLIFDAAHAFGSTHRGVPLGGFGDCEVFSFHATKFLNSLEGGAIATNNGELAQAARNMRNFGFVAYDDVRHPGTNGKMVEACAAMGIINLDGLDAILGTNRRNYETYAECLVGVRGVQLLQYDRAERSNYQYVVVEVGPEAGATRDELVAVLTEENVLARRYFWPGCHRMKPYSELFPWADAHLPNTRAVADRVMVLPTGSSVTPEDIVAIAQILRVVCGTA